MPLINVNSNNGNNHQSSYFSITKIIDSGFKYLRNIRHQPISLQIAIGAGSGWYIFCIKFLIYFKTNLNNFF